MKLPLSRILIGAYTLLVSVSIALLGKFSSIAMDWTIIAASSGLVMMISAWLGIDLSGALSRSFEMPKGQAERIDITRYVFSLFMLLAMATAIVSRASNGKVQDEALAILIVAIALVIAFWIASRKATKLARSKGVDNEKNPSIPTGVADRVSSDRDMAGTGESETSQTANSSVGNSKDEAASTSASPSEAGHSQQGCDS